MIQGLKLTLSALISLAITHTVAAQDWHYFGIDAADQKESLLHSPDDMIGLPQAGERSPLWKLYYDEAPRERLDCQSFQSIMVSAQVRDPLLSALKQGGANVTSILTRLAQTYTTVRPRIAADRNNTFANLAPATANLPAYSTDMDTSWLDDQFLFCGETAPANTLLYTYAFGNAKTLDRDWRFTNDLKLYPERWQAISKHALTQTFEPYLALIRQSGILTARGGKSVQRDIAVSSWAGEYGLYPALAWFHTFIDMPDSAYQGLSLTSKLDRPHLLAMDMTRPFVEADIRAPERSTVDEAKYSNAPLFFFMLVMYSDLVAGDITDWMSLVATPVTDQKDILSGLDRLVRKATKNPNAGLDTAFAHFAGHHLLLHEKLGMTLIDAPAWQDEMFDGCTPVEVSEFRVIAFEEFELPRFSARCFKIFIGADNRAWQGQANLKLTGPAEAVQEVSFSVSKISKNDDVLITCKAKADRPSEDCLLAHDQAQFEDGSAGRFARLDLPQEDRSGDTPLFQVGETYEVYVVMTRVPAKPNNAHIQDLREEESFTLAVSTDVVSAQTGLSADGNWTTRYRLKQPGMSPGPIREWDMGDIESMVLGRADGVLGQNFVNLDRGDAIIISNDEGDELTLSPARPWNPQQALEAIEIEADPSVLEQKKTGTFPAYGTVVLKSGQKGLSYQDLRRPSEVKIIAHTEDALTFEATLNVCIEDSEKFVTDIQSIAQRQMEIYANAPQTYEGQEAAKKAAEQIEEDYRSGKCNEAFGQSELYTFSGSIPYPDTWTQEGRLQAWDTIELDRHTEYIEARKKYLMSGGGSERALDTSTPEAQALSRLFELAAAPSLNAGGPDIGLCQAPIYTAAQGCACTCQSKQCLDAKIASQAASRSEQSCKLFCFAEWQGC